MLESLNGMTSQKNGMKNTPNFQFAANGLQLEYSKLRAKRRREAMWTDISVIAWGGLGAGVIKLLNNIGEMFFVEVMLDGWPVMVILATAGIFLIVKIGRQFLWSRDDEIYTDEIKRLLSQNG